MAVAGGGGQWNPRQTIYYNDRKQEVQPLHSHMAASCLGNKKSKDREDDRIVRVYLTVGLDGEHAGGVVLLHSYT